MAETGLLRKDQLELSLHKEKKLIEDGILKEENPLDVTDNFCKLCDGCRRGDLKVCQEMITEGVNINARDPFDYTPLILVSLTGKVFSLLESLGEDLVAWRGKIGDLITRPAFADTMKLFSFFSRLGLCVREIPSKERGAAHHLRRVDRQLLTKPY